MRFTYLFLWLAAAPLALAKDGSPSPAAAAPPAPAASVGTAPPVAPAGSVAPAVAAASPAVSPARTAAVKIIFLPPPMEGTISLGIYDRTGKLVRVLHREARTDDFGVAVDGLITHWDGRDDAGQPLPAGTYRGRGYSVGALVVRPESAPVPSPAVSGSASIPAPSPGNGAAAANSGYGKPPDAPKKVRLHLVGNPLERDEAGGADVSAGFDAKGSWLQLADGLPLKQISSTPNLKWAVLRRGSQPNSLAFWQSDGNKLELFTVTKASEMMAFDCGDFTFDPDKPSK